MADSGAEYSTWQECLTQTTAICPNFRTAYKVGLFLSGITTPNQSYRISLEKMKSTGAVRVEGGQGRAFTVVNSRIQRR
jgi:hypothetical protein